MDLAWPWLWSRSWSGGGGSEATARPAPMSESVRARVVCTIALTYPLLAFSMIRSWKEEEVVVFVVDWSHTQRAVVFLLPSGEATSLQMKRLVPGGAVGL